MVLEIPVGVTCNNCCVMCTNIMPPPRKWDLSTEEIKGMVVGSNERKIVLTGGEPTIRSDFFEIINFIKTAKPDCQLMVLSNGRMFYYKEFARKFVQSKCDLVAIPLHAPTAELHDSITQAEGSFNQTVQGIKNLINYGADVEIRVVIHKLNYKKLPAIAKFISNELKGARRVVLFPIDIIGNANLNRSRLIVKMTAIRKFIEEAISILEKNGFEVKLFHVPFCVVSRNYWKNVTGKTVEDRRITFRPCGSCALKENCPGIWKTYSLYVGTSEFNCVTKPASFKAGACRTKSNIYEIRK